MVGGRTRLSGLLERARDAERADMRAAAQVIADGSGKAPKPTAEPLYARAERLAEELRALAGAVEMTLRRFDAALTEDDGRTLEAVRERQREAIGEAVAAIQRAADSVQASASWSSAVRALGGTPRSSQDTHEALQAVEQARQVVAEMATVPEAKMVVIGDLLTTRRRAAAATG